MPEFLTLRDRLKRVESFHRIGRDVELGQVLTDLEKCSGCGICAAICPSKALEVVDKKCRMVEVMPLCVSCGDCTAICPEGALTLTRFIDFKLHFRYLDRGRPEPPRKF